MNPEGEYSLRNYGGRKNCSVSYIYPETITLLDLDVGETMEGGHVISETGTHFKVGKTLSATFKENNRTDPCNATLENARLHNGHFLVNLIET